MRDSDHEIPLRLLTWINMSGIPSLTLLSEKQKFNGNNLLQWNINITQLLGSKGLSGYVDRNIQKSSPESLPLPSETTAKHTTTLFTRLPLHLTNGIFVTSLREVISG